ncbi:MAG: phosphate acyltransferase PlsX [Lachnospiraceae bacterium]|nr:phosphate acyltransferase PlsX [Lachnospiraceae bacterium]
MVRVVVDAMGGDLAPAVPVRAALQAVREEPDAKIILIGRQELIEKELSAAFRNPSENSSDSSRIEIVNAEEVIETGEPPVMAIRKKKESSLVKGLYMVKHSDADAFLSAGSSGAILVGGQVIVGRLKGVERPPLAPLIPTQAGVSCLIDCGANVDARPSHLVQFAKMGSIYMEYVHGVQAPKVAIVNIGVEEEKGNMLVRETFPILKNCPDIRFVGSIEARDIPYGKADVVVCEAFVGNVILKLYEGAGTMLTSVLKKSLMTSVRAKLGGLLIKPALKGALKKFNASEYGGAPLLGLNGLVVKAHGSAKEKEFVIAVKQCVQFEKQQINEKINENINGLVPVDF